MISHYQFRVLHVTLQMDYVFQYGTYLASRYEEEDAVNLYHLGSFFAEVYYDQLAEQLVQCRTFTRSEPLEEYACSIRLPEL